MEAPDLQKILIVNHKNVKLKLLKLFYFLLFFYISWSFCKPALKIQNKTYIIIINIIIIIKTHTHIRMCV